MKTIKVTVREYSEGFKTSHSYDVPNVDGIHKFKNREDTLEDIYFVIADGFIVKADEEDLALYENDSARVKTDGSKIIGNEVDDI